MSELERCPKCDLVYGSKVVKHVHERSGGRCEIRQQRGREIAQELRAIVAEADIQERGILGYYLFPFAQELEKREGDT